MRIAIATVAEMPSEFRGDDDLIASHLRSHGADVDAVPWTAQDVVWDGFDLVVVRSTWDYSRDRFRFARWCAGIGDRLENDASLVIWNSDKRYLADLAADGMPTVPTRFVSSGDSYPHIDREVVIKPTVSSGGRNTGRFGPSSGHEAWQLIDEIVRSGGEAMVQPYLTAVQTTGETAVVVIDGAVSHALRKGGILRPDEVAPVRADALGAAEAMYDPLLVEPSTAQPDELELTTEVLGWIESRFETIPVACRVDMVRDPEGKPMVLELEAVEPYLYLGLEPEAAVRLARVIFERAKSRAARSVR